MRRGQSIPNWNVFSQLSIDYFSVRYYTNCVSLKVISASLNLKLCIFKVDCDENYLYVSV